MDFLKAEIARKKKLIEDSAVMAPDKKYFKRADLAAKQEEEYWKKHKRFKLDDEQNVNGLAPGSPGQSEKSEQSNQEEEEKKAIPRKEVVKRLRERVEPIRLFGESDQEAYQRLIKLEMLVPEPKQGFKNDLKAAMDKVDQQFLDEILKAAGGDQEDSKANDVKVMDDGTTLEDILEIAKNFGKGDEGLDCDVTLKFLKLVLKKWGDDLNSRTEEQKRKPSGKLASATHTQTVSYIKPLFRKLKRRSVAPDILGCLVDILRQLLERHYLRANDAYLEMAIGNAPWPIGVTMVGIHARTGREKIFARNVAHVLNDETQRKYIQALKRIMTQCQKYFPTDPSRSVNYEGNIH